MIATMVHGTWARDAAWTRVTSNLSLFLTSRFPTLQIIPCEWSGGNSHAARMDGAMRLRTHILKCKQESPTESQIIFAHSHGGNVAMYALRDSEVAASVQGVICLSTPYLFCRGRDLGDRGINSVIRFLFWSIVLVLAIPCIVLVPPSSSRIVSRIVGVIIGAILTGIAAAILKGIGGALGSAIRRRFKLPAGGNLLEEVFNSFSYPREKSIKILSIRAPGDEATTALTMAHAFSAIFTRLYRVFDWCSEITDWLEEVVSSGFGSRMAHSLLFIVPGALFGVLAAWTKVNLLLVPAVLLGLIGLCLIQTPSVANWLVMLSAILFGFVPFIVLTAICVMTSAFGKDTGLIACFFELTCEATPPGDAILHILTHQQRQDLWHSVPYQSPDAFLVMQSWIESNIILKPSFSRLRAID